jgi:BirA family transcriptional regulator, biotin operon repressor / biotin---[acetyl-CoA-carboxylase] ligase
VPSPYTDLDRPPLREGALRRALRVPRGFVGDLRVVDEVGSTNADLRERALAGAPAGSVLVAEYQSAGRGRLDRGWTSPPRAGLTFSVLLHPPSTVPPRRWPWLPLLTGCAVVEALRSATAVDAGLKWPNDVMVADRKLGGILLERVETPAGPGAIVGIGLNVTTTPAELPHAQATSLRAAGAATVDRGTLLIAVLRTLPALYGAWCESGGDPDAGPGSGLRAAYRARCTTLGRDVRVQIGGNQAAGNQAAGNQDAADEDATDEDAGHLIEGRATDIDVDGRLVVTTLDGQHALGAGDVVHVR